MDIDVSVGFRVKKVPAIEIDCNSPVSVMILRTLDDHTFWKVLVLAHEVPSGENPSSHVVHT